MPKQTGKKRLTPIKVKKTIIKQAGKDLRSKKLSRKTKESDAVLLRASEPKNTKKSSKKRS